MLRGITFIEELSFGIRIIKLWDDSHVHSQAQFSNYGFNSINRPTERNNENKLNGPAT